MVLVNVGRSGEKETHVYIKHPFENQCQVQRSFANTNFSARLKFPAATVATTTPGMSVLRVGLQESLCTTGERRPGNECEFYLSNFRKMPIAHVLGGIVVWNPSSAHPSTSFPPFHNRSLLLFTPLSLSLSLSPSLCLSLPLSLSLTLFLYTYLSIYLSIYLISISLSHTDTFYNPSRASKIIFSIVRVQLTQLL